MKTYSWIKKVGKSLVPSDFYVHILKEPMYKAFLYMLLFIGLMSSLTGAYIGYSQMSAFHNILDDYNSGVIAPFTISKEGLDIEGDAIINIDELDIPIVMADEGQLTINDVMHYESVIFFESDRVAIISNNFDTVLYTYEDIDTYLQLMMLDEFDSEKHMEFFSAATIMSIPVSIVIQFLTTIVQFFYYSVIVLMIGNILRTILGLGLKVKQVYHMTIYAMTFSSFWTNFSMMLPKSAPLFLDTIVHFVIPVLILLNVFIHIRKRAVEEIQKKK